MNRGAEREAKMELEDWGGWSMSGVLGRLG